MNKYEKIMQAIYEGYSISDGVMHLPIEYLEAEKNKLEIKDGIFYQSLLKPLYSIFIENKTHSGLGKVTTDQIFKELLDYIKFKIIENNPDARYLPTTINDETAFDSYDYKYLKNFIKEHGYYRNNVNGAKVLIPELAYIFSTKDLAVFNFEIATDEIINGRAFLKSYEDGWNSGIVYFQEEFKVTSYDLDFNNSENYIKRLHENYHRTLHGTNNGWKNIKESHINTLTHDIIYSYGFYSAILCKVEELVNEHKPLFKNFYNPDAFTEKPKSVEKPNRKPIANEIALAYIFDLYASGKQIPRNPIDDKLAKADLKLIGKEKGFDKPDSFYRAVMFLDNNYNLNSVKDLDRISKRWHEVSKDLSTDWIKMETYLKTNKLIRE